LTWRRSPVRIRSSQLGISSFFDFMKDVTFV
jgi:hypothetical protein